MGELTDRAKGKAKEIGGVVTGDRSLEAEGKRDLTKGRLKQSWERFKEDLRRAFQRGSGRQRQPI